MHRYLPSAICPVSSFGAVPALSTRADHPHPPRLMEAQPGCNLAAPSLSQAVDVGFTRTIERYRAAWSDSSSAVKPTLIPAETFFVPTRPSESTSCPLCTEEFSKNDLLRLHISRLHPKAYGIGETLTPDQLKFPDPLAPLNLQSSTGGAFENDTAPTSSADSWLSMSFEELGVSSSSLSGRSSESLGEGKVVTNPSLFCSLCMVQCDTGAQLETHWNGQKHRRKLDIHCAFAEAAKTFKEEGLRRLAVNSWTCVYCQTEITGKTQVLQHLDASKHNKQKMGSASAKTPRNNKRCRPPTPSTSPSTSADIGSFGQKRDEKVPRSANGSVEIRKGLPPRQTAIIKSDDRADEKPPREPLSILEVAEATSKATRGPIAGVCAPPPSIRKRIASTENDSKKETSRHLIPQLPSDMADSLDTNETTKGREGPCLGVKALESASSAKDPPLPDHAASQPELSSSQHMTAANEASQGILVTISNSAHKERRTAATPVLSIPMPNDKKRNQHVQGNGTSSRHREFPTAKPKTLVSCVLCNVCCNSVESLRAHLASTRHVRKQGAQEHGESLRSSTTTKVQREQVKNIYCEVCKISCCGTGNYQLHLNGKLHAKRLRVLQAINAK